MCSLSNLKIVETGSKYSLSYAAYFYDTVLKSYISPFHDIPLYDNIESRIVNMVVEIPRFSNAKFEINTKSKLNPIKQDVKKDVPRFVHNIFPYCGYPWNYGALPQTWEDPELIDEHTQCKGDNDPIDIIEIGSRLSSTGDVLKVKVVGCIALIDEGETDWKIIAININDPNHEKVNCINSLNSLYPGLLESTIKWFRNYKVPAGSGPNKFAFEPYLYKDPAFAIGVINSGHEAWKKLISKNSSSLSLSSIKNGISTNLISAQEAESVIGKIKLEACSEIPLEVYNVHYINFA